MSAGLWNYAGDAVNTLKPCSLVPVHQGTKLQFSG